MKKFLIFIFLLVPFTANAGVLTKCITLVDGATLTATGSGSIIDLEDLGRVEDIENMTGILSVTNNSGTTPTLDMTVQTCETGQTASCVNTAIVFTQCTTGTCSERIDLNSTNNNTFAAFRASYTLAGTSPNYTVTLKLCHD